MLVWVMVLSLLNMDCENIIALEHFVVLNLDVDYRSENIHILSSYEFFNFEFFKIFMKNSKLITLIMRGYFRMINISLSINLFLFFLSS